MADGDLSEVSRLVRRTRANPRLLHRIVFGDPEDEDRIPSNWTGISPRCAIAILLGSDP